MGSTKKRRKQLITTPDSTPDIRTKVLLRHILEMLLLGPPSSKPHLGQKPKLGGRYTDIVHSCMHDIWSVPCISIFRSFSLCSCFISITKTYKDQKDFICFSCVLFWKFLLL